MQVPDSAIKVCALVPYPPGTTPSQRFRIEQWIPLLNAHGISVDLVPFADEELMRHLHKPGRWTEKVFAGLGAFARRCGEAARASRYDAVLIHRSACIGGPAALERIIALTGRPVIYDFDDAIFLLHTTEANKRVGWLKFPGKTSQICRISAHVVAGNSYLANYARKYNSSVTVIPSSIDTALYRPRPKAETGKRVIVGWMGSSTSQNHLEMFAPVLAGIAARCDFELRVISDRKPAFSEPSFVWRPWSAETEIDELSQFDIGIMPMPDDRWARGKCAMKALQYMAMGIATICSEVGANRELISHGENGLLSATAEEWVENLTRLIGDAGLRAELGKAGRRTIEDRYSMNRSAELFARVVRQTLEGKHKLASPHSSIREINAD